MSEPAAMDGDDVPGVTPPSAVGARDPQFEPPFKLAARLVVGVEILPLVASPPRTLLVRLPNPAGDVVLATSTLRSLRRALPSTRIVWAAKPAALALLDGLADRDETFAIDASVGRGPLAPRRTGRAWRALAPDAVLLLKDSLGAGIAAKGSGAAVRVGYARNGRGSMLTHPVEPPKDANGRRVPETMTRRFARLAAVFGAQPDGRPPALAITPQGEAAARARMSRDGVPDGFLAVSPGAAFGPSKIYPPHLLADAVRRVRAQTGLVPLVLCGPGEEDLARAVADAIGPPVVSTHGDVSRWPETKALLARAALLLGPDAGPRHVAAALGTPVVCVMGPTDPGWTTGDESLVTVVRREGLFCLGCHLRTCPIGHLCMRELSPAIVAAACLDRLRATPGYKSHGATA